MPNIIQVKCNGPGQHVNNVDLSKHLKTDSVLRLMTVDDISSLNGIPDRLVLPCRECTFKVIVTREMIKENQ